MVVRDYKYPLIFKFVIKMHGYFICVGYIVVDILHRVLPGNQVYFYSHVYTRVLARIQPGFTASVNAPNPDCNPG